MCNMLFAYIHIFDILDICISIYYMYIYIYIYIYINLDLRNNNYYYHCHSQLLCSKLALIVHKF